MAKKLFANLSKYCVEGLLEYNVSISNVNKLSGDAVKEVATKGTCNNFISKRFIPMLEELAKKNTFFTVRQIVDTEGNEITHFTIRHNKYSECLFEIFKKIGISLSIFDFGINFDTKTLYLTPANHKQISSLYGTDRFLALTIYIISLAYSIKKLATGNNLTLEYESYAKTLKTDLDFDKINEYVYEFTENDLTYSVEEINYHEIKYITTLTNSYTYNDYSAGLYKIGEITTLKYVDSMGKDKYVLVYTAGYVKDISVAYAYNLYTLCTNQTMDLPSLTNSSIESILSLRTAPSSIEYKENILDSDVTYTICTQDEVLTNTEGAVRSLWESTYNLFNNADIKENVNAKKISDFLDINVKASTNDLDVDAVKELYKDDSYAQDLYGQIQPYYEDFDLKDLNPVVKGIVKGDIYSMIFYGESGSGKSTAARVIASRTGIPYISINCSTNIEETDLFGSMIPNPYKQAPEDPEFIWQDGVFAKALRGNGYIVIIEEGNFARPGILGKLNSLLDENRQVELGNGEILKAPKNFRIIFTCNIAYEGVNKMNKAFVNRFQLVKEYVSPNRTESVDIIKNRTGYTNVPNIEVVMNVYDALKKYSSDNNLGLVVSLRQLLTIFTTGKYYKSAYDAIMNCLVSMAFIEEPDYKEDFVNTVMSGFTLNFKI